MYLQVLTVCDISTATGNRLAPGIDEGLVTLWSGISTFHKTYQAKPNKASWKVWKRALRLFSADNGRLLVPLQHWIPPPNQQHQQWPVYFDPTTDFILFRKVGGYETHRQTCDIYSYNYFGFELILPPTAYPVTLLESTHGWVIEAPSAYCPSIPKAPPSSFESFCSLLEDWESQLLQTMVLHFPPSVLLSMLENDSFQACSDGSAVTQQGTYGWVLSTNDGTRLAHGAGPVDGHDPHSFRSEGQGMLSAVCFLSRLLQWNHSSSELTGTLATDNTGLIDRVREQQQHKYPLPNATFKPDWDVVEAIVRTLRLTTVSPGSLPG